MASDESGKLTIWKTQIYRSVAMYRMVNVSESGYHAWH